MATCNTKRAGATMATPPSGDGTKYSPIILDEFPPAATATNGDGSKSAPIALDEPEFPQAATANGDGSKSAPIILDDSDSELPQATISNGEGPKNSPIILTETPLLGHLAPTTLTEFPQFRKLPAELRLMIWKFAIRPKGKRGVHIFTLFSGARATEKQREEWSEHLAHSRHPQPTASLAAPLLPDGFEAPGYRRAPQPSRYRDNSSWYTVDSGLWTACTESREVMAKHFRDSEMFEARRELDWMPEQPLVEIEAIDSLPVTAGCGDRKKPNCFTIFPMSDLLIVREFNMDVKSIPDLFEGIPLLRQTPGSDKFIAHIAFEMGPFNKSKLELEMAKKRMGRVMANLSKSRPPPVSPSTRRAIRVEGIPYIVVPPPKRAASTYLWFIDRTNSLPATKTEIDESRRFVFYGRGCRYVEVMDDEHDFGTLPLMASCGDGPQFNFMTLDCVGVKRDCAHRWDRHRIGYLRCEPWAP